mmetsp:Transcript_81719/g.212547  ORF Transcript_81719/g.212547 Transcript_81719/m.212547 type:complete len:299 (+) Transcript_81719:98-994(+)
MACAVVFHKNMTKCGVLGAWDWLTDTQVEELAVIALDPNSLHKTMSHKRRSIHCAGSLWPFSSESACHESGALFKMHASCCGKPVGQAESCAEPPVCTPFPTVLGWLLFLLPLLLLVIVMAVCFIRFRKMQEKQGQSEEAIEMRPQQSTVSRRSNATPLVTTQFSQFRRNEEGMEFQVARWIQEVSGEARRAKSLVAWLGDGIVLCKLANKILPKSVERIHEPAMTEVLKKENIRAFLGACRVIGVSEANIFDPMELIEGRDWHHVNDCCFMLGVASHHISGFPGPCLGGRHDVAYLG